MVNKVQRKFLSPPEVLDLVFQKFGEDEKIVSQQEDSRVTLSEASASPGFHHWKGFSGKTKSVLSGDTAYVIWAGQTCTRESNYSYPSLWFEKINGDSGIHWKNAKDKLEFAEYRLKRGIDEDSTNSFCCVNLSELQKWYENLTTPNPRILARGYPIPEGTTSGRFLNSPIWQYRDDRQRAKFPLSRIQRELEVKTIDLESADSRNKKRFGNQGSIVLYSPDVVDYVVEKIKAE
jgi:hypothetical protein